MAISINEQYPGKTAGVSTAYPYGKARNVTAPSDGTGTPWEAAIVNDDQGFKQALLQAAGIIPRGVPDSATASQYLDALKAIFTGKITATFTDSGNIVIPAVIAGTPRDLIIKIGNAPASTVGNAATNAVPVNFTTAFPNTCFFVLVGALDPQGGCQVGQGAKTASGFVISYANLSGATRTLQGNYLAVGW